MRLQSLTDAFTAPSARPPTRPGVDIFASGMTGADARTPSIYQSRGSRCSQPALTLAATCPLEILQQVARLLVDPFLWQRDIHLHALLRVNKRWRQAVLPIYLEFLLIRSQASLIRLAYYLEKRPSNAQYVRKLRVVLSYTIGLNEEYSIAWRALLDILTRCKELAYVDIQDILTHQLPIEVNRIELVEVAASLANLDELALAYQSSLFAKNNSSEIEAAINALQRSSLRCLELVGSNAVFPTAPRSLPQLQELRLTAAHFACIDTRDDAEAFKARKELFDAFPNLTSLTLIECDKALCSYWPLIEPIASQLTRVHVRYTVGNYLLGEISLLDRFMPDCTSLQSARFGHRTFGPGYHLLPPSLHTLELDLDKSDTLRELEEALHDRTMLTALQSLFIRVTPVFDRNWGQSDDDEYEWAYERIIEAVEPIEVRFLLSAEEFAEISHRRSASSEASNMSKIECTRANWVGSFQRVRGRAA